MKLSDQDLKLLGTAIGSLPADEAAPLRYKIESEKIKRAQSKLHSNSQYGKWMFLQAELRNAVGTDVQQAQLPIVAGASYICNLGDFDVVFRIVSVA